MVDAQIVVDDEASSEYGKRSPTPNSVAKTKRPIGRRQAKDKGKKAGDIDIEKSLLAMVNVIKDMSDERKVARSKEMEENRAAKERRREMEERNTVAQERLAAIEERKVAMEEKKAAVDETLHLMEQEKNIFFMDTRNLDGKQKEYINLMRDQVLAQKRMMGGYMGGMQSTMGSMGGLGGIGSTMGATMGGMRGLGGMGATMGGMGGHGRLRRNERHRIHNGRIHGFNGGSNCSHQLFHGLHQCYQHLQNFR
jgi:hypothetical protein